MATLDADIKQADSRYKLSLTLIVGGHLALSLNLHNELSQ